MKTGARYLADTHDPLALSLYFGSCKDTVKRSMARIAYILLCHKDTNAIIRQSNRLTSAGDFVMVHFDKRAGISDFAALVGGLANNPNVALVEKRVACGWGEWSLVQATLNTMEHALRCFPQATHFYMLSGDCMPIKTAQYAHAFLDGDDADYIESFDYFESDWIKTGLKEERLIYRHYFNERRYKSLFYASLRMQQRLGLRRPIPADLQMMIGSQWWCLRRKTVELILDFVAKRPDVRRFFATTWIPDETFFQTLVNHLVARTQIRRRTLTFLMFTDYGMPVTFYDDHHDMLLAQDFLFARKISPEATNLKRRLGLLYFSKDKQFEITGEGRRLHAFLTTRGRVGRRFAPRFWETEASLGRGRELMVIICKKWHVAKRMIDRIAHETALPVIAYLFDEDDTPMPDLGGIQRGVAKRTRHRRAMMRMLFDVLDTDQLVICIDPARRDLMEDFATDKAQTRFLEIVCSFDDEALIRHARRVGLAGDRTNEDIKANLLTTIRNDFAAEYDGVHAADLKNHTVVSERAEPDDNVSALQAFLNVSTDQCARILREDGLFDD